MPDNAFQMATQRAGNTAGVMFVFPDVCAGFMVPGDISKKEFVQILRNTAAALENSKGEIFYSAKDS